MKAGRILFPVFILVALAQLFVPGKMVYDNERVLTIGNEYRFRTAPVDPLDYFRGKYVALSFSDVTYEMPTDPQWQYGDKVYALLGKNDSGYAVITALLQDEPEDADHVQATVSTVSQSPPYIVTVDFPFNRFYMDEHDAKDAELAYNTATRASEAYAIVRVKKGEAVIQDIILDGKPIREAAEQYKTKQ